MDTEKKFWNHKERVLGVLGSKSAKVGGSMVKQPRFPQCIGHTDGSNSINVLDLLIYTWYIKLYGNYLFEYLL